MKRSIMLAWVILGSGVTAFAQSSTSTPTSVVETEYILPKRGMEDKFEAAVKAHDQKFHPDGPYRASLRKVIYGDKAGWYVWVFGPTTYSSLDTRPEKENGHAADWQSTVDPLVEQYGATWLLNNAPDLSYGYDQIAKSKYYEVWLAKIKPGQYYRFKALCQKLKKAYEAEGKGGFVIFNNAVHSAESPDVGILWTFNTFDEWDKDPGIKDQYEKLYGAGSWQQALEEWRAVNDGYSSEIRQVLN